MTLTAHDRKYLAIAMPAALEGVFMNLLSMADLIMVGALGTLSIAAIGIFEQPRMVLLTVARSFASVLVLLTARRVG
ncbi:MAG: MATE family efflux transporter, partial [Selenomonas sp.]